MNELRLRWWYWFATACLLAASLAGTCATVGLDYCTLARIMSLMPWNRTRPLTLRLVWRTFASPPVPGSVIGALGN